MPYNLSSPAGLRDPCDFEDLESWLSGELEQVASSALRVVVRTVIAELDGFVVWPETALLLWQGCNRVPEPGRRQKYFSYPVAIKAAARERGMQLDTRPNGPAIAAFQLGGGVRPSRF